MLREILCFVQFSFNTPQVIPEIISPSELLASIVSGPVSVMSDLVVSSGLVKP